MRMPNNILAAVDRIARITYVNRANTKLWNAHRSADELRLLTGWAWSARNGSAHRQGYKTMSAAYRDAYYELIKHTAAPTFLKVKIVRGGRKAA